MHFGTLCVYIQSAHVSHPHVIMHFGTLCIHIWQFPLKMLLPQIRHIEKLSRYLLCGDHSWSSFWFSNKQYCLSLRHTKKSRHVEIRHIEKLSRFLGMSQCKFKMRFWLELHLWWGVWVSGFGGFRRSSIFQWNLSYRVLACHTRMPLCTWALTCHYAYGHSDVIAHMGTNMSLCI